jgi:hypothetical protein
MDHVGAVATILAAHPAPISSTVSNYRSYDLAWELGRGHSDLSVGRVLYTSLDTGSLRGMPGGAKRERDRLNDRIYQRMRASTR